LERLAVSALELANLAEQAVVIAHSAVARTESRGAHARDDFQQRDDKNWLKHTVAWKDADLEGHLRLSPGASEYTFQRSGKLFRRQSALISASGTSIASESPSSRRVRKCPSSRFQRIPKSAKAKHWPAPKDGVARQGFRIYRWDPDKNANPTIDEFEIDLDHCGPMVLDALIKINDQIDPTLSFPAPCREGVCGSCAMNIDGHNTLACLTPINSLKAGASRITPLPHLPVLKDLIPDLTGLYAQVRAHRAMAAVGPAATRPRAPAIS